MQAHQGRIFDFGPFRLIESERQLVKDGQPIPLQPKVFDTLLALVENRGRLMEKQELMSQLWPGSFVEEVNLNRSISSLRKALGETARRTTYIETVPKCGYRFLAPVIEVETDNAVLILEKHTSAEIITEEEEITDSSQPKMDNAREQVLRVSGVSKVNVIHFLGGRSMAISAAVAVALAALLYFWTIGRPGHATTMAKVRSIAVLPFNDLGAHRDGDHVGLGMTDVLIARLSNLKEVSVRPTSAVQKFEGQEQDSIAVGRMMGVDAVVEGSIYRVNDRIRVTARFVRVSDQSVIWSGQFDDNPKDILAVQDAISEQVADSLMLNLSAGEKVTLTKRYTENADAYQLYVKGRYYWNTRTWAGMTQAEYYFRRAIEKDPNFALAYVGLADRLFTNVFHPEAYSAVNKAIELDPNLGEAYATLGFANIFQRWDWQGAEANFKRSIELSPGYGTAHQWYATLLAITGRVDEAKLEMKRALEIDPTSANFLADIGQMDYFSRQYEEAEAYCQKAVEVAPDFIFAHKYLFDIYLKTGRFDEAFEEYVKFAASYDSDPKSSTNRGGYEVKLRAIYQQSGMNGLLRNCIDEDLRAPIAGFNYPVAELYTLLGDRQQALASLEKSYENKDFLLPFVNADPAFDALRAEPRYQAVLRRMKLAPRQE